MMVEYEIRFNDSIKFLSGHDNLLVLADIYNYKFEEDELVLSKCLLYIEIFNKDNYHNYDIKTKKTISNYSNYYHWIDYFDNFYYWTDYFDKFYYPINDNINLYTLKKIKILDFWDPDDPERKRHKEYFRNYIWEEMMRVFWDPKRKWYMELDN